MDHLEPVKNRRGARAAPELGSGVAVSAFGLAQQKIGSARTAIAQNAQRALLETLRVVDSLLFQSLSDLDGGFLPLSAEESAREWIIWSRSRIAEELEQVT